MDVSIIIVNYNTSKMLYDCIKSIYDKTNLISFEIIVSDNGSTDNSIQMLKENFKEIIIIENKKNLGFGAANNKGLEIAKGKYIFYLNSDTCLKNNAIKMFYDYWEQHNSSDFGALGSNLLSRDNKIIHSYGVFPGYKLSSKQLVIQFITNIILTFFYIFHISLKTKPEHESTFFTGQVDFITGADLFLLNDSFARFDERFFLYFEESDLQRQLSLLGKKMLIIDGPEIYHYCGGSVGESFNIKRKSSFSRIQFELSRVKFLKKYNSNNFLLFIIKLQITINWLNPFLLKNTSKYFNELWSI